MMLEVKYYRVYNFTIKKLIMKDFYTRKEAEDFIKRYDTEWREDCQDWRKHKGNIATYIPCKYLIIEMVGTVESKLVNDWKEGVIEEFELKD